MQISMVISKDWIKNQIHPTANMSCVKLLFLWKTSTHTVVLFVELYLAAAFTAGWLILYIVKFSDSTYNAGRTLHVYCLVVEISTLENPYSFFFEYSCWQGKIVRNSLLWLQWYKNVIWGNQKISIQCYTLSLSHSISLSLFLSLFSRPQFHHWID